MAIPSCTIVLADDHELVRAGIRSILETFPSVRVEAEAGDGKQALELVRRLRPDVLLLDISLPGLNGLEVVERIQKLGLNTRILMLSMHSGPEYVARAIQSGAAGYLVKDSAVDELAAALESVLAGRRYLSDALDHEVISDFLHSGDNALEELAVLTPRQREILQLIAEGSSTREIAERLHVSVKTVETHRAQLMSRLGIRDVPGLVRFAIRTGVITIES
jgi:DNA-binding NarL/FixJ family response regulator